MPSLPTSKPEPMTSMAATDAVEFAKNMVTMMEKKIRNLEKRKGKLEDYKAKQRKGQELTEEQLKAVARIDDVLSQIDLLQDLIKQFNSYSAESLKQQKRLAKKEKFEQLEHEKKRFTEVLQVQKVLEVMGDPETRQAFADGSAGAMKLEQKDFDLLDEFYKLVQLPQPSEKSTGDQNRKAAEHLQSLLDGREKSVIGTTYSHIHDLVNKIMTSAFFTQTTQKPAEDSTQEETPTEKEYVVVQTDELPAADSEEVQSALPPEVPEPQAELQPDQQQSLYQHQPSVSPTSSSDAAHTQAATTSEQPKSFEQIVGNVQGRFNFIQDSEIDVDSPHVDPAVLSVHQLPTQYPQQTPENSMYMQHPGDAQYQQYLHASHQQAQYQPPTDVLEPIPMPDNQKIPAPVSTHGHSVAPYPGPDNLYSQAQLNRTSPTQDSNLYEQSSGQPSETPSQQPHQHEFDQQRGNNVRQGNNGYRGPRGGRGGYTNGYGGHRGPRSDRSGPRGDRGGDRPGNGYQENRRGRGPRGGGGYRGAPGRGRGGQGSQGGRFRSGNQPPSQAAPLQQ